MCGMWDDLLLWERMSEGGLEEAQATMQDGEVILQGSFFFLVGALLPIAIGFGDWRIDKRMAYFESVVRLNMFDRTKWKFRNIKGLQLKLILWLHVPIARRPWVWRATLMDHHEFRNIKRV
jgi:hypothetical protein